MRSPKKLKFNKLLEVLAEHSAKELPFAIFSKPGENRVYALLQSDPEKLLDPDMTGVGFHLAPFDSNDPAVLIRPDFYYSASLSDDSFNVPGLQHPEDEAAREIYCNTIKQALHQILQGELDKVVLSRRFAVDFSGDPLEFSAHLLLSNRQTFRFVFSHQAVGIWAAATPETLLTYDGLQAQTMALAGTKPVGEGSPQWTEKERSEQAYVYQHIQDCFRAAGVRGLREKSYTLQAGTLWHLNTVFSAPMEPAVARALVHQLHPTPAVCGTPLKKALELIGLLENYDREYYTGFAGPTGLGGKNQFSYYVTLRCLQIRNDRALCYVGGGIVSGSLPTDEWKETVAKSKTMLSLLHTSTDFMD